MNERVIFGGADGQEWNFPSLLLITLLAKRGGKVTICTDDMTSAANGNRLVVTRTGENTWEACVERLDKGTSDTKRQG